MSLIIKLSTSRKLRSAFEVIEFAALEKKLASSQHELHSVLSTITSKAWKREQQKLSLVYFFMSSLSKATSYALYGREGKDLLSFEA